MLLKKQIEKLKLIVLLFYFVNFFFYYSRHFFAEFHLHFMRVDSIGLDSTLYLHQFQLISLYSSSCRAKREFQQLAITCFDSPQCALQSAKYFNCLWKCICMDWSLKVITDYSLHFQINSCLVYFWIHHSCAHSTAWDSNGKNAIFSLNSMSEVNENSQRDFRWFSTRTIYSLQLQAIFLSFKGKNYFFPQSSQIVFWFTCCLLLLLRRFSLAGFTRRSLFGNILIILKSSPKKLSGSRHDTILSFT